MLSYARPEVYKKNELMVDMVWRANRKSADAFSGLRDVFWPRDYLFYHSRHDMTLFRKIVQGANQEYPWESMVFIPHSYVQAESQVPALCEAILGNDMLPRIRAEIADGESKNKSRYQEWARAMQRWVWHQLFEHVGIDGALPEWARAIKIFGTAPVWTEWYVRKGPRWEMSDTGLGAGRWKYSKTKNEEIKEDRVSTTYSNPWDTYIDPYMAEVRRRRTTAGARYGQRCLLLPIEDVLAWMDGEPDLNWEMNHGEARKALEACGGHFGGRQDMARRMAERVGKITTSIASGPRDEEDRRMVVVIDHWEPERRIVVAGDQAEGKVLLKQFGAKHPCIDYGIPLVLLKCQSLPGEPWGISMIEQIAGLNHQDNMITNIRNTNLYRSTMQTVVLNMTAIQNKESVVAQPTGVIQTDGTVPVDKVMHLIQWPHTTERLYQESAFNAQQIKVTGGSADVDLGQGTENFTESVRGMQMMSSNSGRRTNREARTLIGGIAELMRCIIAFDKQYVTEARMVPIYGEDAAEEWIAIDPEMIARPYRLKVEQRPWCVNPSLRATQLLQVGQIAGEKMTPAQWKHWLADTMRALYVPNVERYVEDEEDVPDFEVRSLFKSGREMPAVEQWHDHGLHIKSHKKYWDEAVRKGLQNKLGEHIGDHLSMAGLMGMSGRGIQPEQAANEAQIGGPLNPAATPGAVAPAPAPAQAPPQSLPEMGNEPLG